MDTWLPAIYTREQPLRAGEWVEVRTTAPYLPSQQKNMQGRNGPTFSSCKNKFGSSRTRCNNPTNARSSGPVQHGAWIQTCTPRGGAASAPSMACPTLRATWTEAGTEAGSALPAGRPGDARYGPVESSSSVGCEPARCRGRGDHSSVGWTRHARDDDALGVESARPRPHGRGDVTRHAASEALDENVRDRCDCCGGGGGGGYC